MRAEIISIGTEILLGHIVNTNSSYLSKVLSNIGIDVYHHSTVGDNFARLCEAIEKGFIRSDIVITTGGLGPTVDDITLEAIAALTTKQLVQRKDILKRINRVFSNRNFKMPKDAIRQSYIPHGAKPLINNVGTAPGFILKCNKKFLIALPGPPRELQPMTESSVIPYLKKILHDKCIIKSRVVKLVGLPESHINARVKDILSLSGPLTVGIYMHLGQVDLKITCKEKNQKRADQRIKNVERKINRRFGSYIFGKDRDRLQDVVGKLLLKQKKTLAIAESSTGGLLSNLITNTPGSSKYFKFGVISYSNEAKHKLVGVDKNIIKNKGAVSKEVASSLAKNIRQSGKTDFGLATTGIAGPGGGSKAKPVGTVYIGVSSKRKTLVKKCFFNGTREEIKFQTAQEALNLLRLSLM